MRCREHLDVLPRLRRRPVLALRRINSQEARAVSGTQWRRHPVADICIHRLKHSGKDETKDELTLWHAAMLTVTQRGLIFL